ncbi:hypothetical protein B7494_g1737 [Chlorociboria aeruginascens]|nr:hypothetical protein B7494_g1737 [Chlorociboria aeruginascens]
MIRTGINLPTLTFIHPRALSSAYHRSNDLPTPQLVSLTRLKCATMEVHMTNLPRQATENALKKFLRPIISQITTRPFHCQKARDKTFASLTFLTIEEGQRFLAQHGQPRQQSNSQPGQLRQRSNQPNRPRASNLMFYGRPIYCEKSNRDVNPYLVRHLAKEEQDRIKEAGQASSRLTNTKDSPILPISFPSISFSCGTWTYVNSTLVYTPQITWETQGKVKFGTRMMILTLKSSQRIEFMHSSTLCITTEDWNTSAITFSMSEPPRFYEDIPDTLEGLLASLGLSGRIQNQPRKNGPKRRRLPYLDDDHKEVSGNCLVYRITVPEKLGTTMKALLKVKGIPRIIHRNIDIFRPRVNRVVDFKELHEILASLNCTLPWKLKFQMQKLAQNGYLPPNVVRALLPEVANMTTRSTLEVCVKAIRKLFNQINFPGPETEAEEFQHDSLVEFLKKNEEQSKREVVAGEAGSKMGMENVAIIHRAKITPAAIHLYGPEPESNNRVLRKYNGCHEYFLRVQFCDEDGRPLQFNNRVSNEKIFHDRFKKILDSGISIAGREYSFLGFSHSSLRAQSCWFMAPFIYEESLHFDRLIIRKLGDFSHIRSPAKCAARIGQAFSDTPTAVPMGQAILMRVPDVERNGRVFSDGVGTISTSVKQKMGDKLKRKIMPSVYQVRIRGAKGMVSEDPRLKGDVICLRPSMIKFEGSNDTDIEICDAAHRPLPMYLNRQLIKILEDLGVNDKFFLDLQAEQVNRLRLITSNPINASNFLRTQSVGDSIQLSWLIKQLSYLNLDFRADGFLRDALEMVVLMELRQLKHKTRILVENGYHLYGLMDETGILEEGQVFCTFNDDNGSQRIIVGKNLIVSRAPALHPGDVQLVEGINVPYDSPLLSLSNCICFSQKGNRDLPSQLSGGDLDGDRYYITWDEKCKLKSTYAPADYPRLDPIDIGRTVERSDMTDFFIKFMETDQLGRIAVLHRVLADQKDAGTLHPDCIKLAEMHSTAVDFSKTGIPVDMSKMPKYSPYRPDFEAPGPHVILHPREGINFDEPQERSLDENNDDEDEITPFTYYPSDKILGKLYRAIDEREIFGEVQHRTLLAGTSHTSTIMSDVWRYVQETCHGFQWEHLKEFAWDTRDMYEEGLSNIMLEYSEHPLRPLSELEVFVGNILGRTGAQSKQQRELSVTLKERFNDHSAFVVNCILKDNDDYSSEALERSMACLAISLEEKPGYAGWRRGESLLSFKTDPSTGKLHATKYVLVHYDDGKKRKDFEVITASKISYSEKACRWRAPNAIFYVNGQTYDGMYDSNRARFQTFNNVEAFKAEIENEDLERLACDGKFHPGGLPGRGLTFKRKTQYAPRVVDQFECAPCEHHGARHPLFWFWSGEEAPTEEACTRTMVLDERTVMALPRWLVPMVSPGQAPRKPVGERLHINRLFWASIICFEDVPLRMPNYGISVLIHYDKNKRTKWVQDQPGQNQAACSWEGKRIQIDEGQQAITNALFLDTGIYMGRPWCEIQRIHEDGEEFGKKEQIYINDIKTQIYWQRCDDHTFTNRKGYSLAEQLRLNRQKYERDREEKEREEASGSGSQGNYRY